MTFLELFFRAGQVTGLGLIAIFAIIAIIFVVIKALGASLGSGKKTTKKEEPKAEVKEEPAPAEEPAAVQATDDSELIAVLAAAISAYCGEPVTKFRVVSFKHIK
jgi:sodium pump decarboxylase gamma subunit